MEEEAERRKERSKRGKFAVKEEKKDLNEVGSQPLPAPGSLLTTCSCEPHEPSRSPSLKDSQSQ